MYYQYRSNYEIVWEISACPKFCLDIPKLVNNLSTTTASLGVASGDYCTVYYQRLAYVMTIQSQAPRTVATTKTAFLDGRDYTTTAL
jgi:hypothetical protein